MTEINPFQAPRSDLEPAAVPAGPSDAGLWRDGSLLVMHKDAILPERCIRCNAPATGKRLTKTFYWHAWYYFLLLFMNLLIYLVVALIVRQKAKVSMGLCKQHRTLFRNAVLVAWLLVLVGGAIFVFGIVMSGPRNDSPAIWGILLGPSMVVAGGLWGVIRGRIIVPKRIDKHYAWFKKVNANFLADLPDWSRPNHDHPKLL